MEILNHFVIVRTETCSTKRAIYVIHTSINGFIYKIKVFKNEILIEEIEVDCAKEYNQEMNNQDFIDIYQHAHIEMRNKYCEVKNKKIDNGTISFEEIDNELVRVRLNSYSLKKYSILFIAVGIIFFLFITKVLIYSDLYINIFFSKEKDKIAYLEKVERKTNWLAKECILLSKEELTKKGVSTIKSCRKWCSNGIISQESCDLFSAYLFTKNKVKNNKKPIISYNVFPKENIFELNISKVFTLKVENSGDYPINIVLKDISLNDSEYEEIVQFRKAKTSFVLESDEEKSFYIFLEPSYYKQFPKGTYSGTLLFNVLYKNQLMDHFKKQFHFMVL